MQHTNNYLFSLPTFLWWRQYVYLFQNLFCLFYLNVKYILKHSGSIGWLIWQNGCFRMLLSLFEVFKLVSFDFIPQDIIWIFVRLFGFKHYFLFTNYEAYLSELCCNSVWRQYIFNDLLTALQLSSLWCLTHLCCYRFQ